MNTLFDIKPDHIIQILKDKFDEQEKLISELTEENKSLKKLVKSYQNGFDITDEEKSEINDFIKLFSDKYFENNNDMFTYHFTPTMHGVKGVITGPEGTRLTFRTIS